MRDPIVLVAVVIAAVVVALWLAGALRRWRGSRRARIRAERAGAGEDRAAAMLVRAGFAIVARQATTSWAPLLDGEPQDTPLRADYLVARHDQLLVAEVKTGDAAPLLSTAATRRQLLEYSIAFAADGVLLVCPESGTIHRVEFPVPARAPGSLDRCT